MLKESYSSPIMYTYVHSTFRWPVLNWTRIRIRNDLKSRIWSQAISFRIHNTEAVLRIQVH
jgi:hypothetical protein